jgi:energy-converting hydrogenase Eha subunit F
VLAAVAADYIPFAAYPQHIPVVGANGVPVDTPEVQHAKAAHYAAHAEASARAGFYSPLVHAVSVPAVVQNGLPLDTPEVAAAKVKHYSDYAVAAQRNGVNVYPVAYSSVYPVVHGSVYPADTPEVQLAKAQHFAAHAAARSGVHLRKRRDLYAYAQHIPVIGPNGVPVNTPEVQQATAEHLAAHARVTGVPLDTPEVQAAKAQHYAAHAAALTGAHYAPLAYSPVLYGSVYPHAAIGADGHPVETPEVQLAKAAHYAAHAAARRY